MANWQAGSNQTDSQEQPAAANDWSSRIIAAALLGWIVLVTATIQGISWVAQQLATHGAGGGLGDIDFVATLVQALLLLLPLSVLAAVWKRARYRLIFRLWAWAALFNLLASVVHLPGATSGYTSTGLQILIALIFGLLVTVFRRSRHSSAPSPPADGSSLVIGMASGPLLLLPWVAAGALGGPLEAVMNLVAALLFGWCAALLLRRLAALEPAQPGAPARRLRLLGGFVAGGILVPMASSYGFGGVQLLMVLCVPATAWIAMELVGRHHATLVLGALLGLSAAGPLLFVDPREMALAISFGLSSTLGLAFRSAAITLFLAWVVGALLLAWRWLRRGGAAEGEPSRSPAVAWRWLFVAIPAWLAVGAIYVLAGNPGFYGDRLFVILREQADVSEAETLGDVVARRQFVYESLVQHADATQSDLREDLAQFGFDFTPYYLVNALEVEGGPLLHTWLESRPEVARVLYSPILRPVPPEGAEALALPAPVVPPWNISLIGADAVWEQFGVRGAGIVVGQSDSGVQWDHPQLIDGYRGGAGDHDYSWFDPWYGTDQPVDTSGHGTHTLGTVLGTTTGVAPDATWFACANLARNVGSAAYYLDCLQFMLAPFPLAGDPFTDGDPARGANVLNNSWGCPELEGCDPDSLLPAVRALRSAGTFLVVSAGNDGPDCGTIASPLPIYDEVFSVGAIDRFEDVTSFSSRGPVDVDGASRVKPDVVAPGLDILSAFPGNGYRSWQGTSMAGPHVAGVVALMWSANPQLLGDIERTEQILLETARPLADQPILCGADTIPNNVFGYGVVDAFAAVQRAIAPRAN